MIRDKINELLDALPEMELNRAYWGIERIHQEYMFKKNLQGKGVVVSELYEESEGIVQQWDSVFAHNIDDVVKESIHYSEYKWHLFSYEQQKCRTHDQARDAFNAEPKDEVYVMYESGVGCFYTKTRIGLLQRILIRSRISISSTERLHGRTCIRTNPCVALIFIKWNKHDFEQKKITTY